MGVLINSLRKNKIEFFITFCILSNLFTTFLPVFLYSLGLLLMGYKMTKCNVCVNKHRTLFVILIFYICITSMINLVLSPKILLFSYILVLTCPMLTSLKWHLFKRQLFKCLACGFVVVVLINLYAHYIGYNLRALRLQWDDLTDKQFSGFCDQPMWLSAAAAVSTIFSSYLIFKLSSKKWKCFSVVLAVSSLYIVMLSGSRAAFASCVVSVFLVLYILIRDHIRRIKYVFFMSMFVLALSPWLFSRQTTGAMLVKQEYQERIDRTSRADLWEQRMNEFKSSPLIGVGFAAHGVGLQTEVSKVEYGGGWISVLSQMGILGAIIVLFINMKILTPLRKIRKDDFMVFVYALYFFFCAHSIVEGYMFQSGWYMCFVFWLVTGLLIEYKQYGKAVVGLQYEK